MNQINDYIDEYVNIIFIDHIHPHSPVLPRSSTAYPPSFIFSVCVCPFLCVSMTASLSIKFICIVQLLLDVGPFLVYGQYTLSNQMPRVLQLGMKFLSSILEFCLGQTSISLGNAATISVSSYVYLPYCF